MFKDKKEKVYFIIFFGGYIILLIWILLLKLTISIKFPNYIVSRGINLIPFNNFNKEWALTEGLMALLYIPVGLFTSVIIKKSFILRLFVSSSLCIIIEILQWIFSIGITDITDYFLSIIGSFFGIILFLIIEKNAKKYIMDIINGLGLTLLSLGIIFLSLLLLLNISKVLGVLLLFIVLLFVVFYIVFSYIVTGKGRLKDLS